MSDVAGGSSLTKAAAAAGVEMRTLWRHIRADVELQASYVAALNARAELHAEEINAIADEPPPMIRSDTSSDKVDPGFVAWQKNRIDARKWTASRLLPKRYGDKIEVEVVSTDYAERIGSARKRIAKVKP